ncbi:MAG: hypothetical protein PHD40_06740 [Syntrophomonadaceae bacterium]|nr:hypothetical protein [Syntrophomonadaceae bacterium]
MKGKARYVFASSNSSQGFYTFIPELLTGSSKTYILKGLAGSGKSTFIRLLGEELLERGYEVEFWVSPLEPLNPEGIFIPQLNAAVISGNQSTLALPNTIDGEIIYMGNYLDEETPGENNSEIDALNNQAYGYRQQAYKRLTRLVELRAGLKQPTSQYANQTDWDKFMQNLESEILQQPGDKHYFATSVTADGIINYTEELSSGCSKRYLFKGTDDYGKSMLILDLAARAKSRGNWLQYYHCGLIPDNIIMVIIPNLQTALIDIGNKTIRVRPGDKLIDLDNCFNHGESESKETDTELSRQFDTLIWEALNDLEDAYRATRQSKQILSAHMDFIGLDMKRKEILNAIIGFK